MLSDEEIRAQYLGTNPSSDVPIFSLMIASTIFNSVIFYLLSSSIKPLHKSYIVSTIHACISVLGVTVFYLRSTINLKQVNRIIGGGIKGTVDETMAYSVCFSCGYFIYDLIIMLLFKSVRTRSALVHHVIIASAMIAGLYTRVGHSCHFLLLMEELSTIPLNLKALFHKESRLHNLFNYLFVITFILSRLIYGTILCSYTFKAAPEFIQLALSVHDITNVIRLLIQLSLCVLTRILNIYWSILIARKVWFIVRGTKQPILIKDQEHNPKVD